VKEVSYILRPNKSATTPSKSKTRKGNSTTNTSIKNWDNLSKFDGFSPLGKSSLSSTMLGQSPFNRSTTDRGDKSFRKLLNFSPSQTLLIQSQLNTTPSVYSSRIPINNNGLMVIFSGYLGIKSFYR